MFWLLLLFSKSPECKWLFCYGIFSWEFIVAGLSCNEKSCLDLVPSYPNLHRRDKVMRFSTTDFFHESVSPKPLSIPIGWFQIFSKIRGDICSSRCTTGVIDSSGKWKKSSIIKVLIILFGHLWEVELTYRYIFAFKFTLRSQQPDIVPIICHWNWWQICPRYQQH
jgi:hypothetical protein